MKNIVPDPFFPGTLPPYYLGQLKKTFKAWYLDSIKIGIRNNRNKRFEELFKLKDSGQGKTAIVLANGPSVNILSSSKLLELKRKSGADVFCVNFFINSTFAQECPPDYWVLSDPNTFNFNDEKVKSAFEKVNNVSKGILVPENTLMNIRSDKNIRFIDYNDIETSGVFSSNINPLYPRSYLSMSAYKALALALYFGYDKYYICGFDNTYIRTLGCDDQNRIYRKDEHFDQKAYPNDFEKRLLNYSARTVKDEIIAYSRLFSDLYRFKDYPVYNLDPDSLTDCFSKKVDIDIYK